MKQSKFLLTGPPGCGKTTVVRRIIERLKDRQIAGFYTAEIREAGERVGFEAVGLSSGASARLAHIRCNSKLHVGRYGVDLTAFEAIVNTELQVPPKDVELFVIDEIGKMECLSVLFVEAASRLLDGDLPLVATVAKKGAGFIADVKRRDDTEIVTVSSANRERLPHELVMRLFDHERG